MSNYYPSSSNSTQSIANSVDPYANPTTFVPAPEQTVTTPLYTTGPSVMETPIVGVSTPIGSTASASTQNKVVDNLPSNRQIEHTLERVREQVIIAKHETEGINRTGEKILADTERLVDSATQFLREKNEGGKVQRLVQEGYLAQRDFSSQAHDARDSWDVVEGFDSDRLRSLARETLQTARMAGMEIVRSRKFRQQLRSLFNLLSEAISVETSDQSESEYEGDASAFPAPAGERIGSREVEIPIGGRGIKGLSQRLGQGLSLGHGRRLRLDRQQIDQLAERFTDLLRDITQRQSTAQLMRRVLAIFRLFDEEINMDQRTQVTGSLRSVSDDVHLRRTLTLAQEIFETFTGNRTLDPLTAHLREIALIFRKDEEARDYFYSLRRFFVDQLDHPEHVSDHETKERLRHLISQAQRLHNEKIYEHLAGSLAEAKVILRQVERDPATLRLKNDAKALLGDIMLDDHGNVVLKTEAIEQLRLIIIQSLVERMRIPVPSISIDKPEMQLRLSNIVVTLRDLLPESVVLSNRGRMALNLTNLKEGLDTSTEGQELVFEIKNVNIFIEDANIWFKRNKFPKVEDEGKIRISIGGSGVDLKLVLRTFIRAKNILQVERVICDVHNMKLHFYETRHNFLYNAAAKILSGRIKSNVERSVENNIADYIERLNRVLTKQIAAARTKGSHLGPISSLRDRVVTTNHGGPAGETRYAVI